jgi:hypothetical protein
MRPHWNFPKEKDGSLAGSSHTGNSVKGLADPSVYLCKIKNLIWKKENYQYLCEQIK